MFGTRVGLNMIVVFLQSMGTREERVWCEVPPYRHAVLITGSMAYVATLCGVVVSS